MDDAFGETFFTLAGIVILVSLLPVFIAFWRGHPNRWIIFIITVVFGATILGWLIALVWSLHGFHRNKETASRGGASGLNLFEEDVKLVKVVKARPHSAYGHDSEWQDPKAPVRGSNRFTAAEPLLTIAEASALIERLLVLEARGDIGKLEAVTTKRDVLARVR